MDFKTILLTHPYKENKHVALISLNRPKVLNALSTELMKELLTALNYAEDNPEIRTIILTGNEKAFAAGADISEMQSCTPIDQLQKHRFRSWQQLELLTKPRIAAISGFALGGGLELAMSCDLLLASDNAQFGQPEIKIGTMPGAGGTQRLTRAIGKARAMRLILTGEMIGASTAFDWGLLSKIVPQKTLMDEAFMLAENISALAPVAVRLAKESINKSFDMSLQTALEFERRNFFLTFSSSDQKEGMAAFLEKRKANYTGN